MKKKAILHILLLAALSSALLFITRSWWMSLGILMLILLVDALLKQYDWTHQRRVSFEYICWAGQNDTLRHAKELLRLLRGLNCRINLIRFHEGVEQRRESNRHQNSQDANLRVFKSSNLQQMEWLRDYLTENGITTTIRRSRGEDILAACGMLVAQQQ